MAKRTTRLEQHRETFGLSDGPCSLLSWGDLTDRERRLFTDSFRLSVARAGGERDPYELYSEALVYWGIMCPHPPHKRLYGGTLRSEIPLSSPGWFLCDCCGCYSAVDRGERRQAQTAEGGT